MELLMSSDLPGFETNNRLRELMLMMAEIAAQKLASGAGFTPFATISNMETYEGPIEIADEESTSMTESVESLEAKLRYSLSNGSCQAYGICANVITHPKSGDQRLRAIRISLATSTESRICYYIPYELLPDGPAMGPGFFRNQEFHSAT